MSDTNLFPVAPISISPSEPVTGGTASVDALGNILLPGGGAVDNSGATFAPGSAVPTSTPLGQAASSVFSFPWIGRIVFVILGIVMLTVGFAALASAENRNALASAIRSRKDGLTT